MNAEVTTIKTAAETALAHAFSQARARLPGDDAIAAQRKAAFDVFATKACRIAASRSGSTPTCAR